MCRFFDLSNLLNSNCEIWNSLYTKDQAKFVIDFYSCKNWCPLYPLFDKKLENVNDKN